MRTLVMIDNSLSISKDDREKISLFLQDLISDRLNNEEIAIATFSEDITYLTEYTNDYSALKKAAESIVHEDLETYLTDVLYELLSAEYNPENEDIYHRIIVVSDGVDNKTLGYTKEELYDLLKERTIPIYTIGCVNGKNNEQIENMFALSRITSANSFVLDDVENTLEITDIMKQDREITKVIINPTPEIMDGSKKTVKISIADSSVQASISADILMPQKQMEIVEEPVTEEIKEEQIEEIVVEETTEIQEDNSSDTKTLLLIIVGAAIAIILIIVIVLVIILLKKRNKVEFETIDDERLRELERGVAEPDIKTEMINSYSGNYDDDSTCMIWENNQTYQVVLTDIDSPIKSFQAPLSQTITIGRKREYCNIALDYEKSVSSKHCQINVRDERFYIRDLQSANGTYVNNNKVLTETEIVSGNIIKLGRLKLRFEIR